jgi:hypothetical protein
MSSLFVRKRNLSPEMLTLPAFCIPAEESAKLNSKREAQLEWMRAKGVQYILGSPAPRHTPAPRVTAARRFELPLLTRPPERYRRSGAAIPSRSSPRDSTRAVDSQSASLEARVASSGAFSTGHVSKNAVNAVARS